MPRRSDAMISVYLIFLIVLLGFSGFFSSAEVAFFSLNPIQLRRLAQTHPVAARRVQAIIAEPNRFLAGILIGNTLVNVLVSIIGLRVALSVYPTHGEWLAMVGMTLLLLLFGEVGPKQVAVLWPERLACWYALPLMALTRVMSPLRWSLEKITEQFEPWFRPRGRTLSGEEFETVVRISGEQGVLAAGERDMLRSILRLEDLHARDVMTPRVDIVGYDLNEQHVDLLAAAKGARTRQLVLYRGTIDQVEGFLDVRKFLLDPAQRVQAARYRPLFVPEACPLDRLLAQFLRERRRVAVVVDEYGGTAGLVTRGDILEEVVGDIDDEHADHKLAFEPTGPNRWVLDGQISLEEINQRLDLELEADGVDRIAGWLATHLERLPRPGDQVTAQGCRVVVQQMRRHRVTLVQIERVVDSGEEGEEGGEDGSA